MIIDRDTLHVTPRGSKWAVRRPNAKRALRLFSSANEASKWAKGMSERVYVFAPTGRVARILEEVVARDGDALERLAKR